MGVEGRSLQCCSSFCCRCVRPLCLFRSLVVVICFKGVIRGRVVWCGVGDLVTLRTAWMVGATVSGG